MDVHYTDDLSFAYAPDVKGHKEDNMIAVAWSYDGKRLYAGGTHWDPKTRTRPIRIWSRAGKAPGKEVRGPISTVMALSSCGKNLAVAGADPAFGILDYYGRRRLLWRDKDRVDMRGKLFKDFTTSRDGSRVRFGLGYGGKKPVLLDIKRESLNDSPRSVKGLTQPDVTSLNIKNWRHHYNPVYNGKAIKLDAYEISRSVCNQTKTSRLHSWCKLDIAFLRY